MAARQAVLLMAYGSPQTLDDVGTYFTHIRGGRTPPAEQIEELRERYRRIGGTSPLRAITARQAEALQQTLARQGMGIPVYTAMKHAPPFIADVVGVMAAEGIRDAVALALAPHYSRLSVAGYFSAAREAAAAHGIALRAVESWHDHPGFIAALAARLRRALARCASPEEAEVVFTAHSLPERIRTWDDPYPVQLMRTCDLVAALATLPSWRLAYQSASHTGEPWLGPDLLAVLRALAAEGRRQVVVCPVGFVADHLEVLYDIDVEAREVAASLGLRLERAPSLNAEPDFIAALADLITRAFREEGAR
ncbi:MAG: ferrochelatase [Armatimonadota bacterium]|nr:ferrochelatase [Armatimonadota bacterium]MDR7452343.1 ferrochelatase [Armatimonadota bacterium]MDR7466903.1 ferrochelatase [Armatimonadota bacterium]MDR7493555.1 ferrochelatase [Armatimonadota bacterium]MDR7498820.1 ferrochelatase [Armatimonadota bacterium]